MPWGVLPYGSIDVVVKNLVRRASRRSRFAGVIGSGYAEKITCGVLGKWQIAVGCLKWWSWHAALVVRTVLPSLQYSNIPGVLMFRSLLIVVF